MTNDPVVYVVDDDESFLRAIVRRIAAAGFDVQPFDTAEALFQQPLDQPGCVVIDLRLGDASGLDVQDALAKRRNPLPVIFLTGHGDVHSSVRAMKHGAVDFLTKPVSGDDLIDAIGRALALDRSMRAERETLGALRERFDRLTPREREVFALVARGRLNKQIAGELNTAVRTVKAHRANVMQKMGAASVADLAVAAKQLGV